MKVATLFSENVPERSAKSMKGYESGAALQAVRASSVFAKDLGGKGLQFSAAEPSIRGKSCLLAGLREKSLAVPTPLYRHLGQ